MSPAGKLPRVTINSRFGNASPTAAVEQLITCANSLTNRDLGDAHQIVNPLLDADRAIALV